MDMGYKKASLRQATGANHRNDRMAARKAEQLIFAQLHVPQY